MRAGGPRQFAPERRRAAFAARAQAVLYLVTALAIGIWYARSGIDLIPNSTPVIGYADETTVFVAALGLAAWLAHLRPGLRHLPEAMRFRIRVLRADLGNFFFLQHRHADGFLVTAKNSGSHWLKFMLSAGLAEKHGLALPAHSTGQDAEAIIGHPRRPRRRVDVPHIGTTHTIPSALHRFIPPLIGGRAPILVMVRGIDQAMLSNYRKWRAEYGVPFADYVHGDPDGRRFIADAWWYAHFFNRWGRWQAADPNRVLVIRYEDLRAEPRAVLARAAAHLNLRFGDRELDAALRYVSREAIRERQDPNAGEIIVPDAADPKPVFTAQDYAELKRILLRWLRYDFGYGPF